MKIANLYNHIGAFHPVAEDFLMVAVFALLYNFS